MKKSLFIVCSILLLNISSCKKGNDKNEASIGYGTSFGMCIGYCVNSLLINDLNVVLTKTKHGSTPDTKICKQTITETEVNEIKNLLNVAKLKALPEVIGCPDCADGGAEWVSIRADGKEYKVTFDYGHAPESLKDAVAKLKAIAETFKNCN